MVKMDTLNMYLHAETQGEVEHCQAFLVHTMLAKKVSAEYFRNNAYWFTLETDLSVEEIGLALKDAGFNVEVFGTEEYV